MSSEVTIALTSEILKKFLRSAWSENFEESLLIAKRKRQTHKQKIETITEWYSAQRLVMVLGAGSSASYGLPDWNTLLQKLLLISIKSDDDEDSDNKAEKAGVLARTFTEIFEPDSLIAARYLHNYFKKKNPSSKLAFENSIRDALYAGLKNKKDSELLKEIRQLCIAAGRSPNLDSIITYNYDDLVEQCLKNIDVDIPFTPIYSRGMKHKPHELPIYHVHGYLPQKGKLTAKNKVVLSEEGYHHQYAEVYGLSRPSKWRPVESQVTDTTN